MLLNIVILAVVTSCAAATLSQLVTSVDKLAAPLAYVVPCAVGKQRSSDAVVDAGCITSTCFRHIEDDFISSSEVDALLKLVSVSMARAVITPGPTILDLRGGWMRDSVSMSNIFRSDGDSPPVSLEAADHALYFSVLRRIQDRVAAVLNVSRVHATAPTFVTRLIGDPLLAEPSAEHDRYWAPHIDGENTEHYYYSGLLYLNEHGKDFTGGEFAFFAPRDEDADINDGQWVDEHVVLPRAGRLLIFTAGRENPHQVRRVLSGERNTVSMWYTCDTRHALQDKTNSATSTGGNAATEKEERHRRRARATAARAAHREPNHIEL